MADLLTPGNNSSATLARGNFTYFYRLDVLGRGSDISEQGGSQVLYNSKYADINNGIPTTGNCAVDNRACTLYDFVTETHYTSTASIRYDADDWSATLGLQNIFDQNPPDAGVGLFRTGTAALNGYDMRGRRASLRLTKKF